MKKSTETTHDEVAHTPPKSSARRSVKPAKDHSSKKARTKVEHAAPRKGTKLEIIAKLLRRPKGCTTADVLEATGWPAVSMPQQAKALGITLRTEKEGRTTRYWAA